MEVKYLNAFIKASSDVFKELSTVDFVKEDVQLKDSPKPAFNIALVIGISGYISGQVVYSIPKEVAESIISKWLKQYSTEILKKMFDSALGEIANMITGRSFTLLQEDNKLIQITPPSIIKGDNLQINFIKLQTITVMMTSEVGKMEISLALQSQEEE